MPPECGLGGVTRQLGFGRATGKAPYLSLIGALATPQLPIGSGQGDPPRDPRVHHNRLIWESA